MKKLLAVTICAVICLLSFGAVAEENISIAELGVSFVIPDGYIVLTRTNLDEHQEWLANHGLTSEELLAKWNASGTYLEAHLPDSDDVCIYLTAVQDEYSRKYYDLDQQTPSERAAFRRAHLNGTDGYGDDGYTYSYAEWKNTDQYGRFLQLEYKQKAADDTYRGIARRAVRNGYTITLDYKVKGRRTNAADQKVVNKIVNTWHFSQVSNAGTITSSSDDGTGAASSSPLAVTLYPDSETNTGKIKVAGVCAPGVNVTATFMCMSAQEPVSAETTCDKTGKFSFSQTLPKEGTWLTTLTVYSGDTILNEAVLNTTVYSKMMMPISFTSPVKMYESVPSNAPEQKLMSDSTTISGTTLSGVSIQFLINGSAVKEQRTNDTGKFSFKFDTSENGEYNLTLVFSKKGMSTRRFQASATRTLSQDDINRQAKEDAIKPAYSVLTEKLTKYTGRTMVYTLYVTDVASSGDEYVYTMAMNRTKAGKCSNFVVVTSTGDQGFAVGDKITMYGKCTGEYEIQSDEGNEKYPSFELIFAEK